MQNDEAINSTALHVRAENVYTHESCCHVVFSTFNLAIFSAVLRGPCLLFLVTKQIPIVVTFDARFLVLLALHPRQCGPFDLRHSLDGCSNPSVTKRTTCDHTPRMAPSDSHVPGDPSQKRVPHITVFSSEGRVSPSCTAPKTVLCSPLCRGCAVSLYRAGTVPLSIARYLPRAASLARCTIIHLRTAVFSLISAPSIMYPSPCCCACASSSVVWSRSHWNSCITSSSCDSRCLSRCMYLTNYQISRCQYRYYKSFQNNHASVFYSLGV